MYFSRNERAMIRVINYSIATIFAIETAEGSLERGLANFCLMALPALAMDSYIIGRKMFNQEESERIRQEN